MKISKKTLNKSNIKSRFLMSVTLASLGAISACQQNPLPEGGIVQFEPAPFRSVGPVFSLVTPPFFEFQEGVETTHQLDVAAADGKTLVLEYRGLPPGATFDAVGKKLTWKPKFDAGNKGNLPLPKQYEMQFILRNSSNSVEAINKTVFLIVKDMPQEIQMAASTGNFHLKEGSLFSFTTKIKSEDYPNGPFILKAMGELPGIQITPVNSDKTEFKVQFQPRPSTVVKASNVMKKVELIAVAPDGREVKLDQTWNINNVVFPPIVSAPTQLTANEVVAWTVTAEDPNAEGKPTLTVPSVPFGKITTQDISLPGTSGQNPSLSTTLFWSQIPVSEMNKTHGLEYEVCSGNASGQKKCSKQSLKVKLSAVASNPPIIDRKSWPLGQTKYALEGSTFSFPISVVDGNGFPEMPSVTVQASSPDVITYSQGTLTILAKTPKLVQVNLTATTSYGERQVESLLLEVLPKTWGDTLIIGDHKKDPEIDSIFKFSEQVQFLNPSLQGVDERTLAFRKRLIVSTAALSDPDLLPGIEYLASKIPNVLLMSPKIVEIKGALRQEFNSLNVETLSRLNQTGMNLKVISNGVSGAISIPHSTVKINGSLTDDSKAPAIVQAVTNPLGSNPCKNIFAYVDASVVTLGTAAVECKRANGGLLLISGVEFGDLSFSSSSDEKWIASWFKNWGKK